MNNIFRSQAKIKVFRTHIEVYDYDLGDCPTIEKCFSIYDMTYHKRFPMGMIYDKENRILMLPRGIDIGFIERHLNCNALVDTSIDPTGIVSEIKLRYKPRDEVQQEAIRFMLSMDKYKHNENSTMMSINLNTGKGKTYCAIATAAFLRMRSIVITDNVEWLNQWKEFFLEYTDMTKDEIYLIAGAPSMMKLFNRDISKYKVILCTHSTLKSVGDKQGWNKIREFFQYCQIAIKFYDEAHLNFDNMFQIDCYSNSFLTYYLTASPGRSSADEDRIFKLYFKNVPSINLFNQEVDPHTKYAGIRFNSNPSPLDVKHCKNNYGLNRSRYTDYLVRNENFHRMLYILIDMVRKKPNGKHLFYIGTNEAILYVRDWIYEHFPEFRGQVGVYTSITPVDQKAKELEKVIILSTTKSAGLAMDIKGLVETVNLAEPFKSKILAQQTIGRTRDKDTLYKDIVDTGFLYTKKFYESKKPVFEKYASECIEININNKELIERSDAIIAKRNSCIQPIEFFDK